MAVTFTLKQYWEFNWPGLLGWQQVTGSNPMSITAGSMIIAFFNYFHTTASRGLPTDTAGTFLDFPKGNNYTDPLGIRPCYQCNATGGNHTITPTTGLTAGNDDGLLWIYEVTGMPNALKQTSAAAAKNASAAKNWSINSGSGTPQAGDLAIAFTLYENSIAQNPTDLTNPSGWTQLAVQQNASNNLPSQLCWQIVSATGSINVAWAETLDNNKTDDSSVIITMTPVTGYPSFLLTA